MRSFAIWVAWQVFMQADLIVHENVLGFDIRVLQFFFGATHVCIPFVEDPAEQGLPTKRPRRLTAFVKNEHNIKKTSVTPYLHSNCNNIVFRIRGTVNWDYHLWGMGSLPLRVVGLGA